MLVDLYIWNIWRILCLRQMEESSRLFWMHTAGCIPLGIFPRFQYSIFNIQYSTWNIPQVSMKFTNWRVGRKRLIILKVDFQEYKGACTGGDQVLDNMLNQGQSGTDSQVSKIFLKKTHFFKFEINTGKDIDFSFINCSRSVLFCICGGDCVVLFVRKLFVQNGLCGNRPFCYNLFDTRDLWRPLYNL